MATLSSILAGKSHRQRSLVGYSLYGLQIVRHSWVPAHTHWLDRKFCWFSFWNSSPTHPFVCTLVASTGFYPERMQPSQDATVYKHSVNGHWIKRRLAVTSWNKMHKLWYSYYWIHFWNKMSSTRQTAFKINHLYDSTKINIEMFPKYLMLCLTSLDHNFFFLVSWVT